VATKFPQFEFFCEKLFLAIEIALFDFLFFHHFFFDCLSMSSDSESERPTPAKKPCQSKVRLSEAFKSEYAQEFAGDMIKVSLKTLFHFLKHF